ncbi:hypothetical protein DFH06DRAFT_427495 [Mycena polygramma]|nr:hypothetical protein DFH06DRAFT_427495 [Mycena polygramma]
MLNENPGCQGSDKNHPKAEKFRRAQSIGHCLVLMSLFLLSALMSTRKRRGGALKFGKGKNPIPTQPPRVESSNTKLLLLLIPQSQTAPLTHHELPLGPGVDKKIAALLGCSFVDSVVLHSEDQIAYAKKKSNGVGSGNFHRSYEAWMDDNAVAARPLNQRACDLLQRPKTYGPIAVMKTKFIKSDADVVGKPSDIVCFEMIDEQELLSNSFKALRAEWITYTGTGDAPLVIQVEGHSATDNQPSFHIWGYAVICAILCALCVPFILSLFSPK